MNFGEVISIAKLFSAVTNHYIGLTNAELEVACEALKKLSDGRNDWNQEQKELWKLMVDYGKEQTEGRLNG